MNPDLLISELNTLKPKSWVVIDEVQKVPANLLGGRAVTRVMFPFLPEELGHLFEGFVFTVLRAYHQKNDIYDEINYWSPAESKHTEIDFLLSRGKEKIAIEVKAKDKWSTHDLKGLTAISELKGVKRSILVTLGTRKMKLDSGIEVLPFTDLNELLVQNKL